MSVFIIKQADKDFQVPNKLINYEAVRTLPILSKGGHGPRDSGQSRARGTVGEVRAQSIRPAVSGLRPIGRSPRRAGYGGGGTNDYRGGGDRDGHAGGSAACIGRGALNARLAEQQCVARLSHALSMRLAVSGQLLVNSAVLACLLLACMERGSLSARFQNEPSAGSPVRRRTYCHMRPYDCHCPWHTAQDSPCGLQCAAQLGGCDSSRSRSPRRAACGSDGDLCGGDRAGGAGGSSVGDLECAVGGAAMCGLLESRDTRGPHSKSQPMISRTARNRCWQCLRATGARDRAAARKTPRRARFEPRRARFETRFEKSHCMPRNSR
jgi:hypothetical protein